MAFLDKKWSKKVICGYKMEMCYQHSSPKTVATLIFEASFLLS